jgi:hypothetical protein
VTVNELVGMTLSGPVRKATERDRTVIWWLAHDAYWRAQVSARRIKTEQRLRVNFERMAGEVGRIGRSGDLLLGFVEETHACADETEPIVGRKDDVRSPLRRSDVEAFQNWARRFRPEATPTWGHFLGAAFQSGDAVETSKVGIHSATGALAVIIPGLVKRRGCDRLIKKLIEAIFGVEIKLQEVVYRRKVFLTQRGFLPPV